MEADGPDVAAVVSSLTIFSAIRLSSGTEIGLNALLGDDNDERSHTNIAPLLIHKINRRPLLLHAILIITHEIHHGLHEIEMQFIDFVRRKRSGSHLGR